MRHLICILFTAFLFGCNSSGKKDPNKEMDDTARRRDIPANDTTVTAPGIQATQGMAADIPAAIKLKGTVQEVWRWKDSMGENLLITTSVAPFDDIDPRSREEGQTAELHAFHYAGKNGNYKQVWSLSDVEKACPFDITCNFIPGSTTVTDLDKDGIAEIKVQYAITCRSDVSPASMKLLLYEKGAKYVLRGTMWMPYGPDIKYDVTENDVNLEKFPKEKRGDILVLMGRYENEKGFTSAPPEFLPFARSEWLKHGKEKIGE